MFQMTLVGNNGCREFALAVFGAVFLSVQRGRIPGMSAISVWRKPEVSLASRVLGTFNMDQTMLLNHSSRLRSTFWNQKTE